MVICMDQGSIVVHSPRALSYVLCYLFAGSIEVNTRRNIYHCLADEMYSLDNAAATPTVGWQAVPHERQLQGQGMPNCKASASSLICA